MKRLIVVALFVNAFLLAGRFWQELPANAGGTPLGLMDNQFCADADGNGNLDMSDAITILNYLFLGTGQPYCLAVASSPLERIEALEARVGELEDVPRFVSASSTSPHQLGRQGEWTNIDFGTTSGDGELRNSFDLRADRFEVIDHGTYLISADLLLYGSDSGGSLVRFIVNEEVSWLGGSDATWEGDFPNSGSLVVTLEAGDTVGVQGTTYGTTGMIKDATLSVYKLR